MRPREGCSPTVNLLRQQVISLLGAKRLTPTGLNTGQASLKARRPLQQHVWEWGEVRKPVSAKLGWG